MLVAVKLSVCIITLNEEANLPRTLESVKPLVADGQGEIILVDSGSTDRTVEIAKSYGARVFVEEWKGFAAQKNSAIQKAQGEWILSLDADEELAPSLTEHLPVLLSLGAAFPSGIVPNLALRAGLGVSGKPNCQGYFLARKNLFLGRWIKRGGFFPDAKLRIIRKGAGRFELRAVHETLTVQGLTGVVDPKYGELIHHAYPTLSGYIEHMNKYSSLGAEMAVAAGKKGFSLINIIVRPWLTFVYNYFLRRGFLDGKEGLLLHLYHSVYVSWKYAKVYELTRTKK